MFSDALLRTYVDEVFMTYDRDRSGSLETEELAYFFNDVFEKMNNNERFTTQQARNAIMQVDSNFDGRASKNELFNAIKRMMSQGSNYSYNPSPSSYNAQNYQTNPQFSNAYNQQYTTPNMGSSSYGYPSSNLPNKQNAFFADTTSKLQPQSLLSELQPSSISHPSFNSNFNNLSSSPVIITRTQIPGSYVSTMPATQVITSSTVNEPGYTKITTVKGPGYEKVTTETYTSSSTYKY